MQIKERIKSVLAIPDALACCLPPRLAEAIRTSGAPCAEEIRLHAGRVCTVTCGGRNFYTDAELTENELSEILERMCNGSLYAYRDRICAGYVTISGGIRVGIVGRAAMENGKIIGVGDVTGLVVRLPHAHRVSTEPILRRLRDASGVGGVLVYSPPGVGKTTFLRAAAIEASSPDWGFRTAVIDTREEFFATLGGRDLLLDVLAGYPHDAGIEIAVRNLGAELIVCDEIGSESDALSILSASNRGVPLLASAHARTLGELLRRPVMARLHRARVFGAYAGLSRNGAGGFRYDIRSWEDANADFENSRCDPDPRSRGICHGTARSF